MSEDVTLCTDYRGRLIRLTAERRAHILEHPEMIDQFERIIETVQAPDLVIVTAVDSSVSITGTMKLRR